MSFFSLFHRSASDIRIVVDVGSHSVKAVVFDVAGGNGTPRPLKKAFIKLPFQVGKKSGASLSGEGIQWKTRLIGKLRELLFALVKDLGRVPSRITIALGESLGEIRLETWTASSFTIGTSLSKEKVWTIFDALLAEQRNASHAVIAWPVEVLANGYRFVFLPDGVIDARGVRELSFRTIVFSAPQEIGEKLFEMRQSLGGLPIEFVSLAAMYERGVPEVVKEGDVILVDVGGEETVVMVMKTAHLTAYRSFPIGAHAFVHHVANAFSLPLDTAESVLRQYIEGLADEQRKELFRQALREQGGEWERAFLGAIDSLYPAGPFSRDLLLVGGGATIPEVGAAVRKPDWFRGVSHLESPLVRITRATTFTKGESFGGLLQGPEEAALASLIVYSLGHAQLFSKAN